MYGLDLFSGIGGITKALEGYVRPVAYCENDRYAQAVLLSRMQSGDISSAPIWDDVRTLRTEELANLNRVDIVYGGFPCQDISCAGRGAGLEGKRSGLFFEIVRLVSDIRPQFVFLENVPAIRTRGGDVVAGELARLGYDCRWDTLSAAEVGANHKRDRWWLLAYSGHGDQPERAWTSWREAKQRKAERQQLGCNGTLGNVADSECSKRRPFAKRRDEPDGKNVGWEEASSWPRKCGENVSDAHGEFLRNEQGGGNSRWKITPFTRNHGAQESVADDAGSRFTFFQGRTTVTKRNGRRTTDSSGWWSVEPDVGRVANGIPQRVDRLRALGNAVVPAQAREAFERLMGL